MIEQAKGALRLVYGMNDEQAFRILQWRSQENNTKLRALATRLVTELETLTSVTSALRTEFDHLIMTVHERAPQITTSSPGAHVELHAVMPRAPKTTAPQPQPTGWQRRATPRRSVGG